MTYQSYRVLQHKTNHSAKLRGRTQIDTQTHTQTDRETDRETDRHKDRQTETVSEVTYQSYRVLQHKRNHSAKLRGRTHALSHSHRGCTSRCLCSPALHTHTHTHTHTHSAAGTQ